MLSSRNILSTFRRTLQHSSVATLQRHLHSSPALHFSTPPPSPPSTIKVSVDGREIEIKNGMTVLQACEQANVTIPRFCYHDRLSIAGNCRMCLVEVEKSPKPVASCAMPAMPGMKIKTDTPLVKKAREGVMEFLLINHPLDCPICDQGGECDLQDQSLDYGSDRSRFREYKRTVEDKNIGPLVKTVMTRCIHCTRCVRYTSEICGVSIMGTTGRGNAMEVGTYVDRVLDTELSGNVIDLCPVGALTSKPYAFTARPWDLQHTESIDVTDALGANIVVDTRGPNVMRIEPRLNEQVNEEWISDKARFSYDALKRQRLDTPLLKVNGEFKPVTWVEALKVVADKLQSTKPEEMIAIIGDHVDAESILVIKEFFNRLNCNNTVHQQALQAPLQATLRPDYLFNTTVEGIEDSDLILLIATNPRMECAVLSARMRKANNLFKTKIASVGPEFDMAIDDTQHLGNDVEVLKRIANGQHPFAIQLKEAKRPMIIVGMSAFKHSDPTAISSLLAQFKQTYPQLHTEDWNGLSLLHTSASRVAAQDLGFVPGKQGLPQQTRLVYAVGADEALTAGSGLKMSDDVFVVYQGSHGDLGAEKASVIFPSPAYTERQGLFINLEGRVQKTRAAVSKLSDAREDWAILRALSEIMKQALPYNKIEEVRERLFAVAPHLKQTDQIETSSLQLSSLSFSDSSAINMLQSKPFSPLFENFFMTDALTRSSATMAKCTKELPNACNSYKVRQSAVAQQASTQQRTKLKSQTH